MHSGAYNSQEHLVDMQVYVMLYCRCEVCMHACMCSMLERAKHRFCQLAQLCFGIVPSGGRMEASTGPGSGHGSRISWPDKFILARHWESNGLIRAAFRMNQGKLLSLVKPSLVGVASLRAFSLNKLAVELTLDKLAVCTATAKSPPVDWLKPEAGLSGGIWICISMKAKVYVNIIVSEFSSPGFRALQPPQCPFG